MAVRAAVYIRVSTDEQADHGISIPAQESRLAAYCRAQGWEIHALYIDDGYSGKNLDRPAVRRLVEDAGRKKFDTVLVIKLDRLSRSQKDVLHLLEDVFGPAGVGFRSATESFDTTTPFGKAALGMMAVFAQLERETIVERVRLAKRESARQGRFPGGPAPYGYRYSAGGKALEVDEGAAGTVRWVFDRYLAGLAGCRRIAGELADSGLPGPTGRGWSGSFIRKMLANPVYAGLIRHGDSFYPGRHRPIVDPEKWRRVQALARGRGAARAAAGESRAGFLSGLIWCGECGARMRAKNVWQNYPRTDPKKVARYYVCYSQDGSAGHMVRQPGCRCGYRRAGEIERAVALELCGLVFDPELVRRAVEVEMAGDGQNSARMALSQAASDLAALERKIERWYAAYERGALGPEELAERVGALRERKDCLRDTISSLESGLNDNIPRQAGAGEVLEVLLNFPAVWEEAAPGERRELALNLVRAVRVYRDGRVEVDLNT